MVYTAHRSFQTGSGNKVKTFVALLPLGDRTEPVDIPIVLREAVAAEATSISVEALTGMIAGGTPIEFPRPAPAATPAPAPAPTTTTTGGSTPSGTTAPASAAGTAGPQANVAYLTRDVFPGETVLPVEPLGFAIATGIKVTYKAKLRLLGGTSTGANIGANRTNSMVFEDPLGYEDGVITSQSWEVPWKANLLASDLAYRRVFYAATRAIEGRELFVWQYDPPPAGYKEGDALIGAAVVTGFSKDFPSDGIVTFSCTFNGQGSPQVLRYKV